MMGIVLPSCRHFLEDNMNQERYYRQLILKGFGSERQNLLSQRSVLVIGAGGLGCPALQYLTGAGVGSIGIADDDVIELTNLHRQTLYTSHDLGLNKAIVAATKLKELNPDIRIDGFNIRIYENNMLEIFSKYDIIFDGTDNFKSRYLINDACRQLGKPLVFAAVSGFEGQLAIFNVAGLNGISTNYRDIFPQEPEPGEIPNCAENGILGVTPGIIGTMAAAEIIKLITGIGKPLINKLLHYNILTLESYEINITPSSPMPAEHQNKQNYIRLDSERKAVQEIDAETMFAMSKETSALLIDVRERHEYPKLNSEMFYQVPMSEFEAFLQSEVDQNNIILICQHGIRSVAAAERLDSVYGGDKNIYSLKGGIAKWKSYFNKMI